MKKVFIIMIANVLLFSSCGGPKVSVEQPEIPGEWGPFLELMPGQYKIEKYYNNAMMMTINMAVKRKSNVNHDGFDKISLRLLDKYDKEILGVADFDVDVLSLEEAANAVSNGLKYVPVKLYSSNGYKESSKYAKRLVAVYSKAGQVPKLLDCELFDKETSGYIGDREIIFTLKNGYKMEGKFYYLDEGPSKMFVLEQTAFDRFDGKNIYMTCYPEGTFVPWGDFVGKISEKTLEGVYDQRWNEKGYMPHKKQEVRITTEKTAFSENDPIDVVIPDESVTMGETEVDSNISSDSFNSASDDKPATTSSSKNNWDEILNSYEQYVDRYISLLKKAQNGDTSAMTEYVKCMEKAQELSDKLSNAEDDMTPAQMQRYMKILQKMTDAAASF